MIAATSVAYSLWFLIHLIVAAATIVIVSALRYNAQLAIDGTASSNLEARFPLRTNWAARTVHLAPLSGLVLTIIGGRDDSFARAWVGAGLALYFALAFWMEARVLPSEREVARSIRENGVPATHVAQRFSRHLDVALVLLTLILLTMVVQF